MDDGRIEPLRKIAEDLQALRGCVIRACSVKRRFRWHKRRLRFVSAALIKQTLLSAYLPSISTTLGETELRSKMAPSKVLFFLKTPFADIVTPMLCYL